MTVQWRTSPAPVPYPEAVRTMEERVAALRDEGAPELVWLLEHPPLYTAGTSADPAELLEPDRFPVFATGRGGRFTYHGPGQRVGYVILDLKRFDGDVRGHVWRLEEWIIRSLADMDVTAVRRAGRVGVWVPDAPGGEAKIAAIGVRVRRWVSYHGIAINVSPDLSHFTGIVPCGLGSFPVTSLAALGTGRTMAELDRALARHFPDLFGAVPAAPRASSPALEER